MQSRCYVIMFLLSGAAFTLTANAQWVRTTGINPPPISALTNSGDTLYAGSSTSDIYRSTNLGADWSRVLPGGSYGGVSAMFVHNNIVFAGITDAGVFRSTNGGASFAAANNGLATYVINGFAAVGKKLFVATDQNIFFSTDEGTNWQLLLSLPFQLNGYTIATIDTMLFTALGHQLLRSQNAGATWTVADSGLPDTTITKIASQGNILFAYTPNNIFRSNNFGSSWHRLNSHEEFNSSDVVYLFGDTTFVTSYYETSWFTGDTVTPRYYENIPYELGGWLYVGGIVFACSGEDNYGGSRGGVWRSTDHGKTWTQTNLIDAERAVYASGILCLNNLVFAISDNGVFRSTDDGASWNSLSTYISSNEAYASCNGFLYTAGYDGVQRSSDFGATWITVNSGLANTYVLWLQVQGNDLFGATQSDGVWHLAPGTQIWTAASSGLYDLTINAFKAYDNNLVAETDSGNFMSTNQGALWTKGIPFPTLNYLESIVRNGTSLFIGYYGSGVSRSDDGGTSWTVVNTGLADLHVIKLLAIEGNIFAATEAGVFATANNGASWHSINDGFDQVYSVHDIGTDDVNLFVATSGWVWRRPLQEVVGVQEINSSMPLRCALENNFPNPFSSQTQISFSIDHPSPVTIKIFDMHGREVQTLVANSFLPGTYQQQFTARQLPNGVYTCRMIAGNFVESREMVVLK